MNIIDAEKIDTIAPFTIPAWQKDRLAVIAKDNHRSLTGQLRHLIARCVADHEKRSA